MLSRFIRMNKGSSLVEVVVVASVLGIVALGFFGSYAAVSRLHERNMLSVKGSLLAEEGIEAVRFIKDNGWSNLSSLPLGADRYLELGSASWSVTTVPEVVDGTFYRSFRLASVSRDSSADIVSSGGTVDLDTLLVESFVSWNWRGATTSVSYKTYVTNI